MTSINKKSEKLGIKMIWKNDLTRAFREIRTLASSLNCDHVGISTYFPDAVYQPFNDCRSEVDHQYQQIRDNVNNVNIIQLGMTFMNENGEKPTEMESTCYQFNFKLNLNDDMHLDQESIDSIQVRGNKFLKHKEDGIEPIEFSELLKTSGILSTDNTNWLSLNSGYDFGYLLKLLTNRNLPSDCGQFYDLVLHYFPNFYDIKYLIESKNLNRCMQLVADQPPRVSLQRKGGSDSHFTGMTFFTMKKIFLGDNERSYAKYSGYLYGLGTSL